MSYRLFKSKLKKEEGFEAFKIIVRLISKENIDAVKADKEWSEWLHSRSSDEHKKIIDQIEKWTSDMSKKRYQKLEATFNKLYEKFNNGE